MSPHQPRPLPPVYVAANGTPEEAANAPATPRRALPGPIESRLRPDPATTGAGPAKGYRRARDSAPAAKIANAAGTPACSTVPRAHMAAAPAP